MKGSDNLHWRKMSDENKFKRIKEVINRPDPVTVHIDRVKNVNWNEIKPQRGGVIIYSDIPGSSEKVFCMGIDSKSDELTDFGGGIHSKETVIGGCLRELMEETLSTFGVFNESCQDVQNSVVVYNEKIIILFIKLNIDFGKIINKFNMRVKNSYQPEVKSIVFLSQRQLFELVHRSKFHVSLKMYGRVARLLNRVIPQLFSQL